MPLAQHAFRRRPPPEQSEPDLAPPERVSFWKPNATVSILDHFNAYQRAGVPQQACWATHERLRGDGGVAQCWTWLPGLRPCVHACTAGRVSLPCCGKAPAVPSTAMP